ALRAELAHRLDPDRAVLTDLRAELPDQEATGRVRLLAPGRPLDPGVDVLRVLTEDDDVQLLRLLDRRRHAPEVADGADARVEVEDLAERDVQRSHPAADGRRQRPLDPDPELAKRLERLFREPLAGDLDGLLARVDFHPFDPALILVRAFDRRVEDSPRRAPDVGARPITLDEGDDRPVRDPEPPVLARDRLARGRDLGEPVTTHRRPPQPRSSSGRTFFPIGPTYSACGRIRRLSASCSMTCAVHPAARAHANTFVNMSVGIPSV